MALREIRNLGDEILRKKTKEVLNIDTKIHTLLDDMYETMVDADGVGLAAPQVGILKRIFIVEDLETKALYEFINPVILESRGEQINEEGCLSVPNKTGYVERPEYVKIKGTDRNNEEFTLECEGFLAMAVCHEYDHLDGILYVDKVIPEDELEGFEELED